MESGDGVSAASLTSTELSEHMTAYQAGDLAAFDDVYHHLRPPLRRYLLSLTLDAARAEDLVQETFLQILRSRHTWVPPRPVAPWAFGVARHVFLMDRRAARRRAWHEVEADDTAPADLPTAPVRPLRPLRFSMTILAAFTSFAMLAGLVTGAIAGHFAASLWTHLQSPGALPPGMTVRLAAICFAIKLGLGLPVVLFVLAMARRGLVSRPFRVGLGAGLGAGLIGDAVWRLICPYSDLRHVLVAHSGGMLAVVATAACLTAWWQRRQARR